MKPKAIDLSTLRAHAFAELLPMMSAGDRAELRASLLSRGWDPTEPITLYKGQILDGRNRFEIVQEINSGEPVFPTTLKVGDRVRSTATGDTLGTVREIKGDDARVEFDREHAPAGPMPGAGAWIKIVFLLRERQSPIEPTFTEFSGTDDDALAFVLSKNVARRHLTPSQRAMVAATLVTSRRGRPGARPDASPMISQYAAASKLGVSERSVRKAVQLLRENPALAAGVTSGESSLNEATSKASKKEDTDEWYTPPEVCDMVRAALGGAIDVDPASCATAQRNVRARRWYSKKQDGLRALAQWHGRVFLNPPYSNPAAFITKLVASLRKGTTTEAVVLVNNDTDTDWCQLLLQTASAVVFPRGRFSFLRADGSRGAGNRQGQIVFYLGRNHARFLAAFAALRGSHGRLAGRAGVK